MNDMPLNLNTPDHQTVVACSAGGRLSARIIRPARATIAPPLLVLHGISRNPGTLAQLFAPEAERTGRTIIVPYFPAESWPVFQRPGKSARPDQALLSLLDLVAAQFPDCAGPVEIFGHSGGAQLAHRFAMLYPHRVAALHLVAAGWYCLPNTSMPYPYGLGSGTAPDTARWARRSGERLREFLALPTCVYVGTGDVTRDPALRKTEALDVGQGPNRYTRARSYVRALNAAATHHDLPETARFVELLDCGHDVVTALTDNDLAARVLDAHDTAD